MKTLQMDFISGKWEAEKGMDRANNASRVQHWKELAEKYLFSRPKGTEFTADDLINHIGVPDETKNNVVGAWFNAQSKKRKITFTGRMKKSERVSRHTGLMRVWMVN